ncbi:MULTISPECIES: hypothetical protein [unclassified Anabaena]|uniref:hypothetical protein n=1 Tax=unclassified Anabaena TaxID=2619674 RepID=UPI0039C62FAF
MTAVRKSAVSPKGNWFRRNSTPSVEKQRSLRLSESTVADQSPPVPTLKKRRSSLSTTKVQELAKQPISPVKESVMAAQVRPQSGFLNVPVVPNSGAAPFWLLRLYTSHRYSSIVAFLLVNATLVVYGLTVYSQDLWGQGYRKLQDFQLYERQLTTTNATLKNQMAEEAEKQTSGLVSPTPARTLFLPTSPPSASSLPTPATMPNLATPQQTSSPLGY